ncbi:multidrug ABC transporter substrate-binding protein [Candidatus Jorgensenbacteria bacterium CG10_big_fil_rev_8_21_14_0_10_54_38]|uniref:Multidrug ABC transporter substrate-binding protein n=2 Tax=Candidatus Joergenseniibacteriota TaxID=1752739 RepID=A0A2M6WGN6_9BACT|nr:MAG: multidrug ABC transporter substrate-binding protein [Candidatus Jorgensenbacteria bacterium CG23_combo_of_CG06-09_8_20_14_all_54_14]PIT91968.1 MAG: multidrug ABC transporter substrate-binding protein [Candidatus Jorgensenbacteria bacterium CG10_big_fil_rev_8_21_14_0_10_54_38]
MTTADLIEETYFSLTVNKVRTGLTMLGIVIGIGSVIAMVSIGQGAQGSIESSIQSIGSNLILVMPGTQRGPGFQVSQGRGSARSLKQEDADAIAKEVSMVNAVAPELSGRYQVTSKGKNTNTQVIGTVSSYPSVRNVQIDEGSFITDQHVRSIAKVAVIGPTARDDLFGEGVSAIGQTIRIKQVEFKIVGITKTKGGSGFGSQDDMIFVPLSSAQRFLAGDEYLTTISIQAQDADAMAAVQQQVTDLLLNRHHISEPTLADFNILNQSDIVATASSITNTLTILLGAIAGISLLVGGIGIMNMMLTTVTERTREIGLRKAIGAKNADISVQFLTESVVLTFLGGLVGVFFGWLASSAVTQFAGIATAISLTSVLLAFGVSGAIGVAFGYYPARRAASLNPIEALRYE